MTAEDVLEKALEILQKTDDGKTLNRTDRYLVDLALDGELSDDGEFALNAVYRRVVAGR